MGCVRLHHGAMSTTTAQAAASREQQIDALATRIMDMVEAASPIGSEDGGTLGTEALLSALIRRTGPFGYSHLTESIPVKRA